MRPEQRRHFRTRLGEAEDVVDEEQHVLALFVAEILGLGEAGQRDPGTGAGRLVHLAVDQGAARAFGGTAVLARIDVHLGLDHLVVHVVAFAAALADAREHRIAAVVQAMLLISSCMVTVLPTPAPPIRPILPPLV